MDFKLRDRVALITGAAGGIGTAIAQSFTSEGCNVALVDAQPVPDTCGVSYVADVRDRARAGEVVDEVIRHFGRLDILVCSAGITRDAVSWKLSESDWDDVIGVNLTGCFNYARAVTPAFRAQRSGRIVNISSINGMRGKFGQANYAASKGGVIALTKTLARELGAFGVTVNAIAPGMVATAMTASLPPELLDLAVKETALGELTMPEDVAAAVLFLCSPAARRITGEVLRVDAGQYI